MSDAPRILFVCAKFGSRSVFAAHICNLNSPWGVIAEASSFEEGKLSSKFFSYTESLGFDLKKDQLPSLFEHYKRGESFDHVVMMCSEQSGEHCHIFSLSVRELYGDKAVLHSWDVPDFSRITGTPDAARRQFLDAVASLDTRIVKLLELMTTEDKELIDSNTH